MAPEPVLAVNNPSLPTGNEKLTSAPHAPEGLPFKDLFPFKTPSQSSFSRLKLPF